MKHPIHPILVHFPVACWTLSTAIDLIIDLLPLAQDWLKTMPSLSVLLIIIGLLMAIPAMFAGMIDLASISNRTVMKVVYIHMSLAVTTWTLYAANLYFRFKVGYDLPIDLLGKILSTAGCLSLMGTGWFGGKMIYLHGVGVQQNCNTKEQL